MKGIFMYHLERKEEAIETIKSGIKQDLRSSLCWNILGLVYRMEKNLAEAAKCYKTAAKFDPLNVQIRRDLATIQVHLANYEALVETRLCLVKLVPTNRTFWIALSVAYKLNNDVKKALDVLDEFESSIQEERDQYDNLFLANELSRISEFKLHLLIETSQWNAALEYLEKIHFDNERMLKYKALLSLKNGKREQAHSLYFSLLSHHNCDCSEYLNGWIESLPSSSDPIDALLDLSEKFPKSHLVKTRFLTIAPMSESLEKCLVDFVDFYLEKGNATCYSLVKSILFNQHCLDSDKKLKVLQTHLQAIPSSYASYLLQAHLCRKSGDHERAHRLLDAVEVLCTNNQKLSEFHFVRSKVYKNQGNISSAIEAIERVRVLNPKDRYYNTKTVKYLLLQGDIEHALQLMALFFPQEKLDHMKEFLDLQPVWFCDALMTAYHKKGDNGKAFEYACRILEYFEEMLHDPYDFHGYCLRKMTICQYLNLLELTKHLCESPQFLRALEIAAVTCQPVDGLLEKMQQLSVGDSKLPLVQRSIHRLPQALQTPEMLCIVEQKTFTFN